jgi:hypothetical protein
VSLAGRIDLRIPGRTKDKSEVSEGLKIEKVDQLKTRYTGIWGRTLPSCPVDQLVDRSKRKNAEDIRVSQGISSSNPLLD